jgi:putative ABC transport system permease protein
MLLRYTLRNMWKRKGDLITVIGAITACIAATVFMLGALDGLMSAIRHSGRATNTIVLSKNAVSEDDSRISREELEHVKIASGVATASGQPLVSAEQHSIVAFERVNGLYATLTVRGVDPMAFQVHPDVHVVEGRMPGPGEPGAVIGIRMVDQFRDFHLGKQIQIGTRTWPVVGVLAAPGTRYESEIWCDRAALGVALHQEGTISIAYVTLSSADQQPAFMAAVGSIVGKNLVAYSERAYFERLLENLSDILLYLHAVQIMIAILALGAVFACTNAMHVSFLSRMRELATMRAIGFTRWKVASMVLQESLTIAIVGGVTGVLVALPFGGWTFTNEATSLVYSVRLSADVLVAGMALAVLIGGVGSLVAVVQTWRMRTIAALRAA